MGCGCITPASTIHIQKGQYVHSIKVTRNDKESKRKIGQISFGQLKNPHYPFSKKEFTLSKPTSKFDSKYSNNKNTHGSIKNIPKNPLLNIQDIRQQSNKKKKNVKFNDQPRLSIKLQTMNKTDFDSRNPLRVFDKQNIIPKKFIKKPKYMINRVRTQNQQGSPFKDNSSRTDNSNSKSNETNSQLTKNYPNQNSSRLPNIRRVQTQENDAYLESLKEIVLFGETKNQLISSRKEIRQQSKDMKKSYYFPDVEPLMDRVNFKRKKRNFF